MSLGAGQGPIRPRRVGRERPQTFAGTQGRRRLLIIDCPGVRMPAYTKVRVRTASVLVPDVAFADIARHDEDLLGRLMQPCFAPGHDFPQTLGAEQHPRPRSGRERFRQIRCLSSGADHRGYRRLRRRRIARDPALH